MYCQTSRVVQSASGLIFWITFAARQLERFHFLKIRARGRLIAPERREPRVIWFQAREQRLHFPQLAAVRWIGLVQNPELRFLVGHTLLGFEIK